MEAAQGSSHYSNPGLNHLWLGAFVTALEDRLRARHGVREYTRHPDCVFRMQLVVNSSEVQLSDGIRVRPGDRVINLHLWNEQAPPFPEYGPTFAWARRINHAIDISLRELGLFLATQQELDDVTAVCANMTFGSAEQSDQLARIARRYGFERIAMSKSRALNERVHRFGENVLIWMLVLARNAAALRLESLWRNRTLVFLSRPCLEHRYGITCHATQRMNSQETHNHK